MRIAILASLLLAGSMSAAAQTAAAPDQAIVVTGQRDSRQAISDFVKSLTPVDSNGQLSRFEHEVCPIVYGLGTAQAKAVEDRIRLVAKDIGIHVGAHAARRTSSSRQRPTRSCSSKRCATTAATISAK